MVVCADQQRRGCWWGAGGGLGSKVLEGKARAEQPDRPAASTRVIAEPCVLYRAGAKALSLPFSSIPLSAMELGSLWFSSLSSRWYTPPCLCPSLHFRPHTHPRPLLPSLYPCIILHLLQITHQLQRPSTNSVTVMPTDGNFLWSCPVIGGETSKQRTAGEGWYITERLHFHFQGCLVNAPNPASGRK